MARTKFLGQKNIEDFCYWFELLSKDWELKGKKVFIELLYSAVDCEITEAALNSLKAAMELLEMMKELYSSDREMQLRIYAVEDKLQVLIYAVESYKEAA